MSSGLINRILKKLADITYPWPVGMVYPSTQLNFFTDINLKTASGRSASRIDMTEGYWAGSATTSGVWTRGTATTCDIVIVRNSSSILVSGYHLNLSNVSRGTSLLVGVLGTSVSATPSSMNAPYSIGYADGGQCIFGVYTQNSSVGTSVIVRPIINKAHTTNAYTFTDGRFDLYFKPMLKTWVDNSVTTKNNTREICYTKTGNTSL